MSTDSPVAAIPVNGPRAAPASSAGAALADTSAERDLLSPSRRSWNKARRSDRLLGAFSIVGGLVVWDLVARFVVDNSLFLVGPFAVATRMAELFASGEMLDHIAISGLEFAGGLVAALVVGTVVGILMATFRAVRVPLQPWVSGLYSTPVVALAPLLVLWFGIGPLGKIVVVFLMAVFPVLISTQAGVESTDRGHVEMARSLTMSQLQLIRLVYVPSALPFMLAGTRLAVGKALIGVVVAELFGARGGLGYLILVSGQSYDMAALFAALVVLAVAGIALTAGAARLELLAAPWRRD